MKKYFILICLFTISVFAQEQKHEVDSEVKELSSFHAVIYKMWHSAWPSKDLNMLCSLVPEIDKGLQKITNAKLPGILRDKQIKWDAGVNDLTKCIDEFKSACSKKDSVGILSSAEKLHSKYEGLVRVVKPVVKEVDQFHQELYLLYHYYMQEKNFEKIQNSSRILETKVNELKKSKLPERLISRKSDFEKSIISLEASVKRLSEVTSSKNDDKIINEAINQVHSDYQALEKVFD